MKLDIRNVCGTKTIVYILIIRVPFFSLVVNFVFSTNNSSAIRSVTHSIRTLSFPRKKSNTIEQTDCRQKLALTAGVFQFDLSNPVDQTSYRNVILVEDIFYEPTFCRYPRSSQVNSRHKISSRIFEVADPTKTKTGQRRKLRKASKNSRRQL